MVNGPKENRKKSQNKHRHIWVLIYFKGNTAQERVISINGFDLSDSNGIKITNRTKIIKKIKTKF